MASEEQLLQKIDELEARLADSEQLIDAIKAGEVDAFAISNNGSSNVFTLQTGDYAYRVLIEEFGEGAVNVTEEGLIVYINNHFFKLVQHPYEKIVGAYIFDFIAQDSQEKFRSLFEQSLTGKARGEIYIQINGDTIPVYVSLTSLQPQLPTVGIIFTDLTESKKNEAVILKYQQDLEEKNQKLLESNAELASFAYIASHDLQEPLRKIQTFINRVLEMEYEHFSARTKDYFQRITNASKRMQNLITALLDYSRLNTSHISYESTDLNKIVSEVKNDLNELIKESHAIVRSHDLPTLEVIPHQFTQLFSNIISNAIKYQNPSVPPVIEISAQLVCVKNGELPKNNASAGKYWEIQVSDNGIGFEQQYGEQIFELFQRLHGRAEYEGTGIGLAICKRIVQNHNGFINAIGKPGEGATFKIYIPYKN